VFRTLIVGPDNYVCVPPDILTAAEVEVVRALLCYLPQINRGQIGQYQWRASNEPL
jgi:hypothetical protein